MRTGRDPAAVELPLLWKSQSFFSTVKSELADRVESCGAAKLELFDDIEVVSNQRRRHSTLGSLSSAAYERQRAVTQSPRYAGSQARGFTTPEVAEHVAAGGIVEVDPTGDRRSWGIL